MENRIWNLRGTLADLSLIADISKKIERSGSWRWGQYFASKRKDPIALWHKVIVQKGGILG
jgi:hypothetical protein